ncbi:MAG TPA: RNA polymerase sigma factor [Candidatus Krumholzibacteria bacterium]|nr:RNA polymerase sigma factor [Candidatus Krumholzibacteria bacterium]HPD70951.1 RNA polymerase sigma factor [Candidatus Krumholzibacteria bacterium]HRY39349.1 RNA polymerase sigma factor [Candidatus Krumholzibacteria bacterium]
MATATHRQDRDLVRRAAQGDEQAWRAIYEDTCQPLFNFLCFQAGDRETARDLLQDTYLRALRHLDGYRGDGPLLSWLRGIALRLTLDWRRGLGRRLRQMVALQTESGDLDLAAPDRSDAREADLGVSGHVFQDALRQLSPKQRACLVLHELEDLPFADVAREVGCAEATARVHHHRATQRMRELLAYPVDEMGGQQA